MVREKKVKEKKIKEKKVKEKKVKVKKEKKVKKDKKAKESKPLKNYFNQKTFLGVTLVGVWRLWSSMCLYIWTIHSVRRSLRSQIVTFAR